MNNKLLKNLKEEYKKIKIPTRLETGGWDALYSRMQKPRVGIFVNIWMSRVFVAVLVALVIVGGTLGAFGVVSASMPGSPFYPVKRFGEELIEKTTGNSQPAIENRKTEIVNLVEDMEEDLGVLEKTVEEYTKKVEKEKEVIKRYEKESKKRIEFNQKLEEHHKHFDQVVKNNPSVENKLREVLKVTKSENDDDHDYMENK